MVDFGRSPSGPGYSAEPEPSCTVSAVPVSIPNAASKRLDAVLERPLPSDLHRELIQIRTLVRKMEKQSERTEA
jgi:hypothetical protein